VDGPPRRGYSCSSSYSRVACVIDGLVSRAKGRASLAVLGTVVVFGPFLYLALSRSPTLYFSNSEYVAYRVGSALKILYHETSNLWPVQGIPMGIIQNAIVWLLWEIDRAFGEEVLDFLINYVAMVYGTCFLIVAGTLAALAKGLPPFTLLTIFTLGAVPVYIGSQRLIMAPDYWLFELAYVMLTGAFLGRVLQHRSGTFGMASPVAAWLATWVAVGMLLKVSLLGVGGTLLVVAAVCHVESITGVRQRASALLRTAGLATLVFIATTFLLVWIYFRFDLNHTKDALTFMWHFFLNPNHSAVYDGLWSALTAPAHRDLHWSMSLAVLCLGTLAYDTWRQGAPERRRAAALLIALIVTLAGHLQMIHLRPHDTSLTSFQTFLIFIGISTLLAVTWPLRRWLYMGVLAIIIGSGAVNGVFRISGTGTEHEPSMTPDQLDKYAMLFKEIERASVAAGPRIVFIPDNRYNVGTLEQALLYNGLVGLYPTKPNPEQGVQCIRATRLGRRLFGNALWLQGDSAALTYLKTAIDGGAAVVWAKVGAEHDPEKHFSLIADLASNPHAKVQRFVLLRDDNVVTIARLARPVGPQTCIEVSP